MSKNTTSGFTSSVAIILSASSRASTIVQNRYSPFVFACPVVISLSRNIVTNFRVLSTTKRSALSGVKM